MMVFTVYAIKSESHNYIYVGLTSNLVNRLHAHNSGYEKTTKPYRPYILIYKEEFANRTEAREREKYLKTGIGKSFLRELIGQ